MAIVDLDFNDSTPAPPSGRANVKWQKGGSGSNIVLSANMPNFTGDSGSGGAPGAVPAPAAGDAAAGKFLKADGTWQAAGAGSAAPPFNSMLAPASVTPPLLSAFTWGNQNSATAAANAGGAIYMAEAIAPTNVPFLYKTAPATPWTLVIGVIPGVPGAILTLENFAGLICRESASAKLIGFFAGTNSGGALALQIRKLVSYTADSGPYGTTGAVWVPPVMWLSLTDDGTNLTWKTSIDGQNFKQLFQALRADYFTVGPDQVGIGLNPQSAGAVCDALFVHWAGV